MSWRITSEEIDAKEQKLLEENEENMLKLLNVYNVCMSLLEREVLNDMDLHNILQQSTNVDKLHNFILRLSMRGEKAFHEFMDVLRTSSNINHVQLAAILESCMSRGTDSTGENNNVAHTPRTKATHAALREHHTRLQDLEEKTRRTGDEAERFELLLQEIQGLKIRLAEQEKNTMAHKCTMAVREEHPKLQTRVAELEREVHDFRKDRAKWEDETKRLRQRLQVLEQKNAVLDHEQKVLEHEQGEEKDHLHSLEEQVGQLSARLEGGDGSGVSPRSTIQPANRFQTTHYHSGRGGTSRSPDRCPTRDRWK